MVVQLALAAGASVTGVVSWPEQLARVPDGVTPVDGSAPDAVAGLASRRGATLLVDTLGGSDLVTRSRWVRQGGRAVVIGYVTGPRVDIDLRSWLLDDVALLPVNMIRRERRAREVSGELVERLSAGELRLDVQRFALAGAALALDELRAGRVRGRAALTP